MPIVRKQAASVLGLNGSLILVGITPQLLTISEGLTFNHLSKQVRGHYGGFLASVSELVRLTRSQPPRPGPLPHRPHPARRRRQPAGEQDRRPRFVP
ncbi:hypothetical protein [Streptomyces mirabilis]|uniref:hypothetical protein n=1 Tax=Streptomyces mirabilis TaxID=68239 RepID=UPI0036CB9CB1